MPVPISKLEMVALLWVSTDYEAIHTISKNIAEDYGTNVSDSEIHEALKSLRSRNMSVAYVHNAAESTYEPCEVIKDEKQLEYWWLATQIGLSVLNQEPEVL
jgi:hypothetical protein